MFYRQTFVTCKAEKSGGMFQAFNANIEWLGSGIFKDTRLLFGLLILVKLPDFCFNHIIKLGRTENIQTFQRYLHSSESDAKETLL